MNINTVIGPVERFLEDHGKRVGFLILLPLFLFLWLPIIVVAFMSFADSVLVFPPENFTLEFYHIFLDNSQAWSAIFTSLQVSLVATPIAVALAIMYSYAFSKYDFPGKGVITVLIAFPLVVPLIVVGIALTLLFGMFGGTGSYWEVVIAHVVRILPFAALIILPSFLSFDTTLEEASKDLGANSITTFRRVTLPNILPGVIAGGLLAFTMSFNEFVYTYFVRGTGMETLPVYLWGRIEHTMSPEINVISIVFLAVALLMVAVAVLITDVERIAIR
ncbi:ABC-type transport system permease protein (probable substrate spermidine/putrescine) [Natrialba magadii ATCC 43099]|uniref:ABC-type transport system permease protein (Probable substrate spermidine/putrescine) n=1 Tax=Natrialba magadii (strain ATCC 43099 / DSM 3394 / CCM 3739 / CIP 104546 / IAM 13178 / JCM 8861 / NBRC 102185 / NCIMB 2190 / MS3) TaxID=547559 RepID=D3SWB0_NATMM|nr:ABC transporter permease [Natrialba magadii]ADD03702.1 ABC-type transport system permease protein (probable substrate spermidine/putrescine) [Natrialba magadii ATCC 43099]ELY34466.1 binding-protein-dependent transport system inner membrane protein [Natrialba magadii ATCC 43099]